MHQKSVLSAPFEPTLLQHIQCERLYVCNRNSGKPPSIFRNNFCTVVSRKNSLAEGIISVSRYVKVTKIHQDFPKLWSQMYCHLFYGSQCMHTCSSHCCA